MSRPAAAPTRRTVLQVGDIAGVAGQLVAALDTGTSWTARQLPVAERTRRSRIARTLDLPRRAVATRRAVRRGLRATPASIVHLHWARYAPFLDTAGVPLVVHAHGTDVRGRSRTLSGRLVIRSLRRAAAVLVSTPDLVDWTVPTAIHLPNPIDVDLFAPHHDDGRSAGRAARPTVHLFARLDSVKGGGRLVAIGRELRRRAPDVRVVAFAGGPFDADARAAGVDLMPATDRQGVADSLRHADVVVGQQVLGLVGLSELEAMACQRPVVAPISAASYDSVPPVVPAVGVDETVARCLELIDDPDRRNALGRAGRSYVLEHHAPAVVGARLAAVYDSVAGGT